MEALELARLQFGATTIYHFLFVPITIGLSGFVAGLQTAWYRTGDTQWLRLTRFFGKLLLINFAIGVVTGIVQEFQFGMNWSDYSRFVGDVFGAPLAMEGLIAFFLESVFLGLWIFGWDRLSPRLHLASIWMVAIGTTTSAYFILAANAWMQDPVGYRMSDDGARAEMSSIWEVLSSTTAVQAFVHTILGAFATAGMLVVGVAAWQLRRGGSSDPDARTWRTAVGIGLAVAFPVSVLTAFSGHAMGQHMTQTQPMKMAAAEALWETQESCAPLSLFAMGDWEPNPGRTNVNVEMPCALSVLATNSTQGEVRGINDLQAEYERKFGPGDYVPVVAVTYWSFRAMVGAGTAMIIFTLIGIVQLLRGRLDQSRRWLWLAPWLIALPLIANSAGWIFTEMGRQPWVVYGLLKTEDAVSRSVAAWEVGLSFTVFTLLYGGLAVVNLYLMRRWAMRRLESHEDVQARVDATPDDAAAGRGLAMLY